MIKLVKANIHKDRAVLSAFLMIIILAVTLLHIGRMVSMYKPLYDEKAEDSKPKAKQPIPEHSVKHKKVEKPKTATNPTPPNEEEEEVLTDEYEYGDGDFV